MDILNLVILLFAQFVVFSVQSSSTVTVTKGKNAVLEWDIATYTNAKEFQIYVADNKMAIISRSGVFTSTDDGTKKYGKRIKGEINGDRVRLTITDVTHSDEATFLAIAEIGLNNNSEIGKITLDVSDGSNPNSSSSSTGLSSSDTGMIVGIVIGILILIIIIVVFVCYRKKKRSGTKDDDSKTPMKGASKGSAQSEQLTTDTENHYAHYKAPSAKTEDPSKSTAPPVYSELGPGGRSGPRDMIPSKSNYAEAK